MANPEQSWGEIEGNYLGYMARKQMGIAHTVGLAVLVQKEIKGHDHPHPRFATAIATATGM